MSKKQQVDIRSLPPEHPLLRLQTVHYALPHALQTVYNLHAVACLGQIHARARTPMPDGDVPEDFTDDEFMSIQTKDAASATDAAVLTLSYTTASVLLWDLCFISASCDHLAWLPHVRQVKVQIGDFVDHSFEVISKEKVQRYLDRIKRESIDVLSKHLLQALSTGSVRNVVRDYVYDETRLRSLTNLRCKIAHGFRFKEPIQDVMDQAKYLATTVKFFGLLVQRKYDLYTGYDELDKWE